MIVLLSLTIIYAIVCAYTDLKDRSMIFIPSLILAFIFVIVNFVVIEDKICILINLVIFVVVAIIFKKKKVWGAGDSDYLILFSQVVAYAFGNDGIIKVLFMECILIGVSLLISIIVGLIECYLKDRKFSGKYKAAALPGFSVTTIVLCVYIGGL